MRSTWPLFFFVVATALAVTWVASGCGSSSAKGAPVSSDGGDASVSDVAPEADLDTGPDIDQDPDVYPAKHHPIPQLDYNGGPVLTHLRLVTVTFVGDTHRDSFRDFDHLIVTTPWWKQSAEGFCIDGGTYNGQCVGDGTAVAPEGGAWLPDGSTLDAGDGYLDVELPYDFAGSTISDPDIQTWLGNHIVAHDFPAPDSQTLYVIFFPTTTAITIPASQGGGASCEQFAGYHSYTSPAGASTPAAAYAVIPYCDYGIGDNFNYQQVTFAVSHELAEAATDPEPNQDTAFYLETNDAWEAQAGFVGGECGDMCFTASEINLRGKRAGTTSPASGPTRPRRTA